MTVDLNSGSGHIYGSRPPSSATTEFVNGLINGALGAGRAKQVPRDYLGASRIGEPCRRRLCFEMLGTLPDAGKEIGGRLLRVFDAGHVLEDLSIRWLRAAGFDLRTRRRNGDQFGFEIAGGRIRGHIDGVIVNGPDIGLPWPMLWEHKSANSKSWNEFVKRGLASWNDVYWGQVHLYMAYMDLGHCLFTAVNKDTQELFHEIVSFDAARAQALSDKAVAIIQAAEARELLPRIAAAPDFYLCTFCPFAKRCWESPK